MESLLWALGARDPFTLAWPLFLGLVLIFALTQSDLVGLLLAYLGRVAFTGRADAFAPAGPGERPTGLVIIPSLLRNQEDLDAITTTVDSCATNGYPSRLVVIASVDGRTEKPELYARLARWMEARRDPPNVRLALGGTETRLGKMMAVEAGLRRMEELVAAGEERAFPEVYFSVDGDGTLSPRALERLAARLTKPHPVTGNPRRVVSGKICIHPDLFWKGWRALPGIFFSVEGQIRLQVAREFLLSNVSRHNWKWHPRIGIPGALYCTWSEIIRTAPRYMGFLKTVRRWDLRRWWLGGGPPLFSRSTAPAAPEALTGASDDTCIAFVSSIASWQGGRLSFDAPRTPLHALARLARGYVFERSHDYEPEARVFTYTPSTVRGLWKQRVRWNSSRFECAGRFWRSFWFHWEIGLPTSTHLWLVLHNVLALGAYYVLLPVYVLGTANGLVAFIVGYGTQTLSYAICSALALALEREHKRRFAPALLCLPFSAAYVVAVNFAGCAYGVTRDVLLFGNSTNFAPEWTLEKGRTGRIAILFRLRRFFALCLRAVLYGDVPLGRFWLGWCETPWTPSGFKGWTTGERPRPIVPRPWVRRRREGAEPSA